MDLCSLVSAFVIHSLASRINSLAVGELSSFLLVSVAEQAGLKHQGENFSAYGQSDQHLCYSLIGKYHI